MYQEQIKQIISQVTGREVKKVIFVSLKDSIDGLGWSESLRATRVRNSLRDCLGDSLGDCLGDSPWESLGDSLGARVRENLRDCLGHSLGSDLQSNLLVSFRNSLWERHRFSLWDSLWSNLFYFTGLHLANRQEEADKLKPLLELWTKCLLPGFKKDEPETFIVLVA